MEQFQKGRNCGTKRSQRLSPGTQGIEENK